MQFAYLGVLLFSLAGMVIIDHRWKPLSSATRARPPCFLLAAWWRCCAGTVSA